MYNEPISDNIVVCSVFFNAGNFTKTIMNQLYISNLLKKSKIPHYSIELVYGNEISSFIESEISFCVRSNSYMFHKENLINLLVSKLPDKYTKIVCLDGDVIFENENWINDLSQELDKYDIVVPYHDGCNLDPYYDTIIFSGKTLLNTRFGLNEGNFSSGYAIAFKRNFFDKIGLYEYAIFGGGDKMVYGNFLRRPIMVNNFNSNKKDEYINKLKSLNFKYNYLGGIVYHLYHGNSLDRKYLERHALLNSLNIDTEVIKNEYGVLEFIEPSKYNHILLEYFKNRKEDSI
jgi:hypothetical protein